MEASPACNGRKEHQGVAVDQTGFRTGHAPVHEQDQLRAGFSRKDDTLPERILMQPLPDGPAMGMVCRLDAMLPGYYRCRGWDENGRPTPEKLRELGLPDTI